MNPSNTPPDFLTIDECAELLRVDRKTVYAAVRDGRLPALRIGRLFRVNRGDLHRLLHTATAKAELAQRRHIRHTSVTGEFARLARRPNDTSEAA